MASRPFEQSAAAALAAWRRSPTPLALLAAEEDEDDEASLEAAASLAAWRSAVATPKSVTPKGAGAVTMAMLTATTPRATTPRPTTPLKAAVASPFMGALQASTPASEPRQPSLGLGASLRMSASSAPSGSFASLTSAQGIGSSAASSSHIRNGVKSTDGNSRGPSLGPDVAGPSRSPGVLLPTTSAADELLRRLLAEEGQVRERWAHISADIRVQCKRQDDLELLVSQWRQQMEESVQKRLSQIEQRVIQRLDCIERQQPLATASACGRCRYGFNEEVIESEDVEGRGSSISLALESVRSLEAQFAEMSKRVEFLQTELLDNQERVQAQEERMKAMRTMLEAFRQDDMQSPARHSTYSPRKLDRDRERDRICSTGCNSIDRTAAASLSLDRRVPLLGSTSHPDGCREGDTLVANFGQWELNPELEIHGTESVPQSLLPSPYSDELLPNLMNLGARLNSSLQN